MPTYIVRGQMFRRSDGQRFYPGQRVEIDGKPPAGWEKVKDEDGSAPPRPAKPEPAPTGKK